MFIFSKSCLNFNGPNIIKNINFHLKIILGRLYLFKLPIKSDSPFRDLIKLKYFKRLFYSQIVYQLIKKYTKLCLSSIRTKLFLLRLSIDIAQHLQT